MEHKIIITCFEKIGKVFDFSEKSKKGTVRIKRDNAVNMQNTGNTFTCFERSPFSCDITLDIILNFYCPTGVSKITKFTGSIESMMVFI